MSSVGSIPQHREPFLVAGWLVQPDFNLISLNGTQIHVEHKTMEVLLHLASRPGEVISKEELIGAVWPDTFVSDQVLSNAIWQLRHTFGDSSRTSQFIQTIPKKGYCLLGEVSPVVLPTDTTPVNVLLVPRRRIFSWWWLVLLLPILASGYGAVAYLSRNSLQLTPSDSVVITDFKNSTSDPVFDDTLKLALTVNLQRLGTFELVGDREISETLKLMKHPGRQPLTPEATRDLCQRLGSRAAVSGSITGVGSSYVLDVSAMNCSNGKIVARDQVEVATKDDILKQLREQSQKLIANISANTNTPEFPLSPTTTTSLDALKAYTISRTVLASEGEGANIPFLKRALELDPNFAAAALGLGGTYNSLGETVLGGQYIARAYELRDEVSASEREEITRTYESVVAGDSDKALETQEVFLRTYPQRGLSYFQNPVLLNRMGLYEKAIKQIETGYRITKLPGNAVLTGNEQLANIALGRLAHAKVLYRDAVARGAVGPVLHWNMYYIGFLEDDKAAMHEHANWSTKQAELSYMRRFQADTEAYHGRMKRAEKLADEASELARNSGRQEIAIVWQAQQAWREAQVGLATVAITRARSASRKTQSINVRVLCALALARSGAYKEAATLADLLKSENPRNTFLRDKWLPSIRAEIDLARNDAPRAIEDLELARRFELGSSRPHLPSMIPLYIRGRAYLLANHPELAALEFERIIQHPGITLNTPIGSLAVLGFAQSQQRIGNIGSSREHYQKFLQLWSNADANTPVLRQAVHEFNLLSTPTLVTVPVHKKRREYDRPADGGRPSKKANI